MRQFYSILNVLTFPTLTFMFFSLQLMAELPNQDWDLNAPCKEHINILTEYVQNMVTCALNNSAPPQVCTKCTQQYINFKQEVYKSKHLDDVHSLDNKTCTSVIYDNYVLSYAEEFIKAIEEKIWKSSKCESCVQIHYDDNGNVPNNAAYHLDNKTLEFLQLLEDWRACVHNVSLKDKLCRKCGKNFDDLYNFFWPIYRDPEVNFCVDVETMMNDTIHLWVDVNYCQDPRPAGKPKDIRVVAFSATMLLIIIGLFYAGSYIQTEQAQSNLIQYSTRRQEPRGPRYRLLSSSTLDRDQSIHSTRDQSLHSTPSTSQHG